MKILVLANSVGGLYNFRREVMLALRDSGHEVYISVPDGSRMQDLFGMGFKMIKTDVDSRGIDPVKDIRLFAIYSSMMRKIKPGAVLTYTVKPNIYGGIAASLCGIPYIANITGLGSAVENPGVMQKLLICMYKLAFRKIRCVFFQNEENKRFFEKYNIATGCHRLIPGSGVNIDHFKLIEYPDNKTTEFVFISRIMREKGIDQYLAAAQYIRDKYPNTRFHVCGNCEEQYMDKLKELHDKEVIIYHGSIPDVREIHKQVHCTIHPTYYPEGMSNVLLESCASGRPIITTDRSGCREIVDDGVNGYIVNEKDSDDLIGKIEQFLALSYEEKKQMGLAGRAKVEKKFDRQIVVDAYLDEIEKIKDNRK